MKLIGRTIFFIAIAAATVFAVGSPKHRSIADIEHNAGRYNGKKVKVAGVVRDSDGLSIPGTRMGGGAYELDDGTGSIWVLVTDGNVPLKGAQIVVEGMVGSGITWHGRNHGLGILESKRHYNKK
jgi:hypothetical protein